MSNGSGGGTEASEGVHRLQVRLVMGGHTSGGTAASEGGTVLFWLFEKPQYCIFTTTPRTPNVVCGLGGGQFWRGLGPKLFHTTHNKLFCHDENSIGLRPDSNSACEKNIQAKIRKYDNHPKNAKKKIVCTSGKPLFGPQFWSIYTQLALVRVC